MEIIVDGERISLTQVVPPELRGKVELARAIAQFIGLVREKDIYRISMKFSCTDLPTMIAETGDLCTFLEELELSGERLVKDAAMKRPAGETERIDAARIGRHPLERGG